MTEANSTTADLFREFFETDAAGKPLARFSIEVGEGPRATILNPDHGALILTHIKSIDAEVGHLVDSLSWAGVSGDEVMVRIGQADALAAHAHKLMAQAFYLDTADRNSWVTISNFCKPAKGNELAQCGPKMKHLYRFLDLEAYVASKAAAEEDAA